MTVSNSTVSTARLLSSAGSVKITNLSMGVADQEYTHGLQAGVKALEFKLRSGNADLKFSFVATESGSNYSTVPKGTGYYKENLSFNSKTLYVQSPSDSQVLEIVEYY